MLRKIAVGAVVALGANAFCYGRAFATCQGTVGGSCGADPCCAADDLECSASGTCLYEPGSGVFAFECSNCLSDSCTPLCQRE
jgi:hypothetical protein